MKDHIYHYLLETYIDIGVTIHINFFWWVSLVYMSTQRALMRCTKWSSNNFEIWDLSSLFSKIFQYYDNHNHIICTIGQNNITTIDGSRMTTSCEHRVLTISWYVSISSSRLYHLKNIYLNIHMQLLIDKECDKQLYLWLNYELIPLKD